jgi:hypothetical protein
MIFNTSFPSAFYVTEYEINNQLKLFSSLEAIIGSIYEWPVKESMGSSCESSYFSGVIASLLAVGLPL